MDRSSWWTCATMFFVAAAGSVSGVSCSRDSDDRASSSVDRSDGNDGGAGATADVDAEPTRAEFGLDVRPANATCHAPARPPAAGPVKLEPVYTNVTLDRPMMMAMAPNDASRWFVGLRDGRIVTFASQNPGPTPTEVANVPALSGKPILQDFEGGFLGIAFHPKFASNGRLYVTFTTSGDGGGFASEVGYLTSADNGASFTSYSRVLYFERSRLEHNGGGIAFGKDGYLYLGFGDQTDPANGQKTTGFSAKVIRIDVDNVPSGKTYGIPPTNPWVKSGGEPATFARGFRNPFRLSIDRDTGDLWLGDVGDAKWEEINKVAVGANLGWPCREGKEDRYANDPVLCPSTAGLVDPLVVHEHTTANTRSIIGGVVYRGKAIPSFVGTYVYSDFIQLELWGLTFDLATAAPTTKLLNADGPNAGFSAFAEDNDGEIYVLALFQNSVFKLVANGQAAASTFPDRLSKTGCVDPADPKKPAAGLLPFGVSSPLWSDGAEKHRFVALPDGNTIGVGPDGDFDLPIGSVVVKDFALGGKMIETRLLVRHDDGEWAGYSYEWNDDQTDAVLLESGRAKTIGDTSWTFPSRSDCVRCHTTAAGRTLGLEVGQLNGDFVYTSTGRIANQLKTLEHIGMLTAPLGKPVEELVAYPSPTGNGEADARARSYLHSNCSHCHRPSGGAARSKMDVRFATPLLGTNMCDVVPEIDDLGIADARIVAPGAPERSVLSHRMHTTTAKRMPPLGTHKVDESGVKAIDDWIRSAKCQ